RPRRRRKNGCRSWRAFCRPHSDLPADPRGERHGRAAPHQRARFARRPRIHGRGGAHGGAGVDRELQPADHSFYGGPMTHTRLSTRDWRLATRDRRLAAAALLVAVAAACAPAPQTSNTPAAGTEMPRSIVDPYLKIQSALADDSIDGVKQNAGAIATA